MSDIFFLRFFIDQRHSTLSRKIWSKRSGETKTTTTKRWRKTYSFRLDATVMEINLRIVAFSNRSFGSNSFGKDFRWNTGRKTCRNHSKRIEWTRLSIRTHSFSRLTNGEWKSIFTRLFRLVNSSVEIYRSLCWKSSTIDENQRWNSILARKRNDILEMDGKKRPISSNWFELSFFLH